MEHVVYFTYKHLHIPLAHASISFLTRATNRFLRWTTISVTFGFVRRTLTGWSSLPDYPLLDPAPLLLQRILMVLRVDMTRTPTFPLLYTARAPFLVCRAGSPVDHRGAGSSLLPQPLSDQPQRRASTFDALRGTRCGEYPASNTHSHHQRQTLASTANRAAKSMRLR